MLPYVLLAARYAACRAPLMLRRHVVTMLPLSPLMMKIIDDMVPGAARSA